MSPDISVKEEKPNDIFHSVLKFIDYERGKVFGTLLAIIITIIPISCQSTTQDPFSDNERQVTREELSLSAGKERQAIEKEEIYLRGQVEALQSRKQAYNEALDVAEEALDAKDARKQELLNLLGGAIGQLAEGNPVAPLSILSNVLISGLFGLTSGHVLVDSRRKNKRLEEKKA